MKYCDKNVEKQLLATADRYIFSSGNEPWSMDVLARDCGMSKNTLYKIVGTKEKLIERVLLARINKNQKQALRGMEDGVGFPAAFEQLAARIAGAVVLINEKVRELIKEFPALENDMVQERDKITALLREKFIEAQANNLIKADVNVEVFFKVCQSIMIYFIKHEPQQLFEKRLKEALHLVISGICKECCND
ncbi:MAG: TetR/AcrR family transcriptional regulator [Negativicutes bacterium]|jgi:AcrR family transcriptional regulator